VQLLHDQYEKEPQFNLFSVLRSESDEVRLHSRFLGEILNPAGTHGHKDKFLRLFLKQLDIDVEEPETAQVHIEYCNIDLLIRCGSKAIIIENKIYAGDQDKQLTRYYDIMKSEGCDHIELIYLTLDGREPTEQSISGIDKGFINSKQNRTLSYKVDIHDWLESCLRFTIREPALRESLLQYINIIDKLTNRIESDEYMDDLKNLLKSGSNLVNFLDLQQAYEETMVELQMDIWTRIDAALSSTLGRSTVTSINQDCDGESYIRGYVQGKKGHRFPGLGYPIDGTEICLSVELDHRFYFGISCNKEEHPEKYQKYYDFANEFKIQSRSSNWWPCYQYAQPELNFKNPTKETLELLASETKRQQFADFISKRLLELADVVKNKKFAEIL